MNCMSVKHYLKIINANHLEPLEKVLFFQSVSEVITFANKGRYDKLSFLNGESAFKYLNQPWIVANCSCTHLSMTDLR